MADPFAPRSMKRKNVKGLALTPAAPKPPPPLDDHRGSHPDDDKSAQLEIGIEYKLDLKPEDLEIVKELGSGNGGTVSKVRHISTGTIMARKVGKTKSMKNKIPVRNKSRLTRPPCTGHSRRGPEGAPETYRARTPDHARLPQRLHRQLLRRLPQREQ